MCKIYDTLKFSRRDRVNESEDKICCRNNPCNSDTFSSYKTNAILVSFIADRKHG